MPTMTEIMRQSKQQIYDLAYKAAQREFEMFHEIENMEQTSHDKDALKALKTAYEKQGSLYAELERRHQIWDEGYKKWEEHHRAHLEKDPNWDDKTPRVDYYPIMRGLWIFSVLPRKGIEVEIHFPNPWFRIPDPPSRLLQALFQPPPSGAPSGASSREKRSRSPNRQDSSDSVEETGERTWAQRDAELRQNAVVLDAPYRSVVEEVFRNLNLKIL